ncbi:hypothetical protein EH196_03660 [Bacillus sp. C1-1]|nr:hypothetical protein EH196_03660 [Bacillus sp. C1-1]
MKKKTALMGEFTLLKAETSFSHGKIEIPQRSCNNKKQQTFPASRAMKNLIKNMEGGNNT